MSRTVRYLHTRRRSRQLICLVMLLAAMVVCALVHIADDNSHAADSIAIELDGETVNPSEHIQMTTSSITLTLRSTDNIYNDPEKYAINWTLETEEHQKRASLSTGSSSIYGILTALQPGEVQIMVNVVDKTSESLGVVASASCWVDIIFSVDTLHDDNHFKYIYSDDPGRSLVLHSNDAPYQLGLAFGDADRCQWTTENDEIVQIDSDGLVTPVGAGKTNIIATYTPPGDTQSYSAVLPVYIFPRISLDNINYFTGGTYSMASGESIFTDAFFGATNTESLQEKIVWVIKQDINGIRTVIEDSLGNRQSDLISITTSGGVSNTSQLELSAKAGDYYIEFYPAGAYRSESEKTAISPTVLNVTVYSALSNLDKTILVNDALNLAEAFNMTVKDFNEYFYRPAITMYGGGDATNYVSYSDDTTIVSTYQKGVVQILVNVRSGKETSVAKLCNPALTTAESQFKVILRINDSFTLDRTSVIMSKGQSLQLTPQFTSFSGLVKWESSDPKSVSVDPNTGLIKALKETVAGADVVITAILELDDGTIKKATCTVKVETAIAKFTIEPDTITMEKGKKDTIVAKFSGNVTVAPFLWTSSDPKVCTVTPASDNKSCIVTAVNGGIANIVVTNTDNNMQVFCTVKVSVPIEQITLKKSELKAKMYTEGTKLEYTVQPANANDLDLVWTSSDKSVAIVDNTGVVTYTGPGTTLINVYPKNNPKNTYSQCMLTVIRTADSMTLSDSELVLYSGSTYTLGYTVTPVNSELNVIFSSVNQAIATVDSISGLITAKKAGTTQIFAKGEGLDSPAVCSVTVLQKSSAISFAEKEIIVNTGGKARLKYSLTPADSTDSVAWTSLDSKVATVIDGEVTGVSAGSTYIQAKSESGADAIIAVHVRDAVKGVTLDKNEISIMKGEEYQLNKTFTPPNPYDQSVKWSTTNAKIVTVNENGKIKGESGGIAVVKCITNDGGYQATCIVTVIEPTPTPAVTQRPPTTMTLNRKSYYLGLGKSVKLVPSISNSLSANPKVTWTSSNKKIATVNSSGKVKGKKVGKCTIKAKLTDGSGVTASCTIRVVRKVTSIKLNRNTATLLVGNSFKLTKTIKPKNATIKTVTWTTSNSEVATVNNKGEVFGVAPGVVKIKATAKDGSKKYATCIVTVKEKVPATAISAPSSDMILALGTSKTVGFTTSPAGSTDYISYVSDNSNVVSVTNRGKIYARMVGIATIYATTSSGATASVDVRVVGMNRTSVTLRPYDKESLWVNGYDSGVKWYSQNPLIASVTNGTVVARKPGTTRIYAVVDGTKLSCVVKVTKLK